MLASKRGVYLPKLILVAERQLEVQMDLSRSDLPVGVQKIVKKKLSEENHISCKN